MPDTADTAVNNPAGRMETAMTAARGRASDAWEGARDASRRAGDAIEANPLVVVAGGIAIGLAAGALLPKTRRETELLGPVGRRLTDVASGAAAAAKDAAKAELATLPLSKEAARAQVGKVIDQVARAIGEAGDAALASRHDATTKATDTAPAPRKRAQKAD